MSTGSERPVTSRPLAVLVTSTDGAKVRARSLVKSAAEARRLSAISLKGKLPRSLGRTRVVLLDVDVPTPALFAAIEEWRRRQTIGVYGIREAGHRVRGGRGLASVVDGTIAAPLDAQTLDLLDRLQQERVQGERRLAAARREVDRVEERFVLLRETVRAAGTLLDPGMVSRFVMERAAELVGSARWRLYRLRESTGQLKLEAWGEPPGQPAPAPELPLSRGLAGLVARTREVVMIRESRSDDRFDRVLEWPGSPPRSVIGAPLVSRGRVIGVVELADPGQGRFPADVEVVVQTLMEPAAIALDNALLFRRLEEQTVTDDLTQLYNARFMEGYLRRETKRANRYGHPVALLFLDLDGFKQVNDVHGHMAGSKTLVEVGDLLRRNLRDIDVVARWGGDEFTVVLPETTREGAVEVAERLRRKVEEERFLDDFGLDVRLSVSIGVAAWPLHGTSPETLLAGADAAMYRVKNSGKNGVLEATQAAVESLT